MTRGISSSLSCTSAPKDGKESGSGRREGSETGNSKQEGGLKG